MRHVSEADADKIRWMYEQVLHLLEGNAGRPREGHQEDPTGPELYLALTPSGGIDAVARSSTTGTGSGESEDDVVDYADCPIYRGLGSGADLEIRPMGFTQTVHNVGSQAIPGFTYILATRDKTGTWYAVNPTAPQAAGGGGTTITVRDDSGSPSYTASTLEFIDGTDCLTQPSANVVRVAAASATSAGTVTLSTQTFNGAKTFQNSVTGSGSIAVQGSANSPGPAIYLGNSTTGANAGGVVRFMDDTLATTFAEVRNVKSSAGNSDLSITAYSTGTAHDCTLVISGNFGGTNTTRFTFRSAGGTFPDIYIEHSGGSTQAIGQTVDIDVATTTTINVQSGLIVGSS